MEAVFLSELFELNDEFERIGTFDAIINKDSHFFINLLRLKRAETLEFKKSYNKINEYFEKIMLLLDSSKTKGDKFYRAALKSYAFREVNGINLGFSETKTGSGFGSKLAEIVIGDAFDIVKSGSKQPEVFQLVGLFEQNVGADRLSDMIASLILPDILKYTQRINNELGISQLKYPNIAFNNGIAINPYKNCELLYLPKEILHELPIARDWSDIDRVISENEVIRNEINMAVGEQWYKMSANQKKEYLKNQVFMNQTRCARVLEGYCNTEISQFDIEKNFDYRVASIFREIRNSGVLDFLQHSKSGFQNSRDIAFLILDIFKDWVENNKGWDLIISSPTRQREKIIQSLIHLCGKKICYDHDYDFSFEPNEGPGPADIKISCGAKNKTIIEVKLNSNVQYLHGYEEQLEIYKRAENTDSGIYLYVKVEDHPQRDFKLLETYRRAKQSDQNAPDLFVIDSRKQLSASKK